MCKLSASIKGKFTYFHEKVTSSALSCGCRRVGSAGYHCCMSIMSAGNRSLSDSSPRSDLEEKIDTDAFEIEQESAKLQAEVQKLSKELEDLMSSRRISEGVLKREDYSHFSAVGEEDMLEVSATEEETSRFPSAREDFRPVQTDLAPAKRPARPDSRPPNSSPGPKSEAFGLTAPRPPPPTSEKKRPSGELRTPITGWKQVNEQLTAQGFRPLPLRPDNGELSDPESVCDALRDVLADFARCVEDLEKAEKTIEALNMDSGTIKNEVIRLKSRVDEEKSLRQEDRFEADRLARDLERQISGLTVKLDAAQSQIKQRDELMKQLKDQLQEQGEDESGPTEGSDRDKAIFRQYFQRDPKGGRDSRVLGLISAYEERRKRTSPDPVKPEPRGSAILLKELRSQLDSQSAEIEKLEKERSAIYEENQRLKSNSGPKEKPGEVIAQALETLQLKSEKQLPSALRKMQQVIRALPGLESFIKAISAEVLTGEADSVENILPSIKTWKQKAVQWETWSAQRVQLCQHLRIDTNSDFADIVTPKQLRVVKGGKPSGGLEHFRSLFEVGQEDVVQVMNQVFLFVHEMKGLLQVRSR